LLRASLLGSKFPGGTLVKVNETLEERWEILGARVDVIEQRFTRNAIMFFDEPTLRSQTEMHEARVTDEDLLLAQELIKIHRSFAGLADRTPPALDAILRGVLAFNGIARA
jgi:hypothetical protein